MKNSIKKLMAVLVALTLVFAMFTGVNVSAAETEMKLPNLPDGVEIIEGEVYSFREVLENVTVGLDHEAMDDVYFDGYQWYVSHRQNFTDGPWGIKEDWYARESYGWDGFKCICINKTTSENNSEIWKNHEMMIEWNEADENDKNIYWSLQPLWSCSSNTWINFVAPHTGKIVLFEEFGNKITACSEDEPFKSFLTKDSNGRPVDYNRPWKITVEKNDVKVWPMDDDCAVLDKNNRAVDFPSLGKIGVMPVTEGDIISIRIDAAGEFESGTGYDYEGTRILGNTTATFNPVIAYTEIVEEEEFEEEFEDVDTPNTSNKDDANGEQKGDDAEGDDADDEKDFFTKVFTGDAGWIVYLIIGVGVLVIAAGVVTVILVVKKKKSNPTPPSDDTPNNFQ